MGGWNRTLTEYVDPLLRLLRTHFGVYTIQLFPGNVPVLRHRSMVYGQHEPTVVVNLIAPGVQVNVSYDYSQTITTVWAGNRHLLGHVVRRDGVCHGRQVVLVQTVCVDELGGPGLPRARSAT